MRLFKGFYILILVLISLPTGARADYRSFGLQAGLSFPKVIFAEADYNFSENWGVNYQVSWGYFWSVQQLDALHFFKRADWSPYVGAGYQAWNFFGFSSTAFGGLAFTGGSQASAVTIPAGFLYVGESGFALNFGIGLDYFVSAPSGLQGKVIPEGQISAGYFF